MNKRAIAAVAAGVLALLGVLVLVMWAQGANNRAYEGAKLVPVVRLTGDVNANTSAADLAGKTEVAKLPADAVPSGAVTSLDQVRGMSTNASVQKGELLLKSRMAAPGEKAPSDSVVPEGYQEVSIALDAERSVAGAIKAGDKIGVIVTADSGGEVRTNFVVNQVLVTKVGTSMAAGDKDAITATMVTVAVKSLDAERIVHGQRWGTVWLTLQNPETDTSGNRLLTNKDVPK